MSGLMSEAIDLMFVGMGFVFIILVLLVFVVTLMSKLVVRFAPEPEPVARGASNANLNNASSDSQLLAVLSAAVAKYRSDHKK